MRWGVQHNVSSPHYHQSNGHTEAAVKQVKKLITKFAPSGTVHEDLARGLLEQRNTPRSDGQSPAEVLFGQPLRSCVPAHHSSFAPEWRAKREECDLRAEKQKEARNTRYDTRSRLLMPLKPGAHMRLQDAQTKRWNRVGVVMGIGNSSRDFLVRTPSVRVLWRIRRFLREIPSPQQTETRCHKGTTDADPVPCATRPRHNNKGTPT